MSDAVITLVGNLASDVDLSTTANGSDVAKFRLAYNSRVRDVDGNGWRDGPGQFLTVKCWGVVARNVHASLRKGMPVVVTGRLLLNERRTDGPGGTSTRLYADLNATALGPDLARGRAQFERAVSGAVTAAQDRAVSEALGPARAQNPDAAGPDRIGPYPD